jgi:hypothetical protein
MLGVDQAEDWSPRARNGMEVGLGVQVLQQPKLVFFSAVSRAKSAADGVQ